MSALFLGVTIYILGGVDGTLSRAQNRVIMHILKSTASSSLSLPAENYIYSITAASPGSSFAAISSDDSLRVFDSTDISRVSVVAPRTHSNGVTALKPYQQQQQVVVTGGRDGKVKVWDLRKGNGEVAVEMETGEFFSCVLYIQVMFIFPFVLDVD